MSDKLNGATDLQPEPAPQGDAGSVQAIADLWATILSRKREMPEGSYTRYLFEHGVDKIGKKVGEEAAETIIAAKNGNPDEIAWEVADLWYHTLVLLAACDVPLERLMQELRGRMKLAATSRNPSFLLFRSTTGAGVSSGLLHSKQNPSRKRGVASVA